MAQPEERAAKQRWCPSMYGDAFDAVFEAEELRVIATALRDPRTDAVFCAHTAIPVPAVSWLGTDLRRGGGRAVVGRPAWRPRATRAQRTCSALNCIRGVA
jgi:hypothetical protein